MTTAFVLSGGGSLGAVQVGMLQALADRDIRPDLLIGTSVGAINAAFVAGHGTNRSALASLASIWTSIRRRDVFPTEPLRHLLAVAGSQPSLWSNRGLAQLMGAHAVFDLLEDAPIQLHLVATNLLNGKEVLLSRGDAVSAVLASTALPGILPPVVRDGLVLVDGGVSDNAAIAQARALGADVTYLLPTGYACSLTTAPTSALGIAMQSLTLLIEQRLVLEVASLDDTADVVVLPPLCPLSVSSVDFGHADQLIARAREATTRWLNDDGPKLPSPSRFLSLHDHGPAGVSR